MLVSRFIYQSQKWCNCGGSLKNCTSALGHVISRQVSSCIPPDSMAVPDSFRRFLTRFSRALPFQWHKSSAELLERMTTARSYFSGFHFSRLHSSSIPGKEIFNIIKSACYEIEGPSHIWLNNTRNANKFLDGEGIFLILVNAYIEDDSLVDHHDRILMIEGVKFLQKRYSKLNVIGLQCVSSAKSVAIHSKVLKNIMDEYITFPILILDINLMKVTDSAVFLYSEGSTSPPSCFTSGEELSLIQKAIEQSSFQKEDMSEELNCCRTSQYATIEEPTAPSFLRNLLLSYEGSLSVDENGGRIFLSDCNHHRIIIADGDGKILDSIGSSPGFVDADFEAVKLCRPAGSFYNVFDGCLYFVDSENNAIRRADMERRLVETVYPVSRSSGTWSQILGLWNWILNSWGISKHNEKSGELDLYPIASPWHLLNSGDDELIIISRSFAVAWTMSTTTWKIKEVIRGFQNISESYGNLIADKLSFLKFASGILSQKFSTPFPSEKFPFAGLMSLIGNFGDDIITYDSAGQSLLKYNRESMGISCIRLSNVGLLSVPYWLNCPLERVCYSSHYIRQSIDHVHSFSVLPGRCDITINVEIPKDTVLVAPLDEKCFWCQARGSAAAVSGLEEKSMPREKVGVAQQWYDELDNLAFTNPGLDNLQSNDESDGKTVDGSFQDAEKVRLKCAVNVSAGTSEVIVSAALYLKPSPTLNIEEAVRLLNPQKDEHGAAESACIRLFLEKHEKISDIIFTKPLHVMIKLDCGDHPTALTTKETILTDTSLEIDVVLK